MPPTEDLAVVEDERTESFSRRTTFYVNHEWEAGAKSGQGTYIRGQMYVESLEPLKRTQKWPIILIHGDYHSSQIWLTKPNGDPGWASYFVGKGFQVYLVDLPATGKSNNLTREAINNAEIKSIKASQIEREVTATERFNHIDNLRWPTALKHDKWPGTGMRGDRIFDRYCASLTSLVFSPEERQTLAQNALRSLLKVTKKAILIGEGTGATASWLAADVEPAFVAGVVAVEPPGPPFCDATIEQKGKRKFDSYTSFNPNRLKYGLSTIPLTYSPAARPESLPSEETTGWHPLDLALFVHTDTGKAMVLQYSSENMPVGFHFLKQITHQDGEMHIRKLSNLSKVRHVIFTGEASSHSAYDGSTLHFMQQAGLTVDCGFLERYKTTGNGHLMFLETNSDEVAAHIMRWIQNKAGQVDGPVPVAESEATMVSTTVPSAEIIDVDQQFGRFPKRARQAAPRPSEPLLAYGNEGHLIDLTDEPQLPLDDRVNKTMHTASRAEYVLSPTSSSVFPRLGEMPPPPLPSWIIAPKTPARKPATPRGTDAKMKGHELSSGDSELYTSPGNFNQGYVSVSSSSPERAQVQSLQLVSKQPGIGGPGTYEPKNSQPSHGNINKSIAHSAADSYRKSMAKYLSPPAAEAIPQQTGFKRNGIRVSGSHESKGPQPKHDNFYTPPEYSSCDPLQDLFSEIPPLMPAQVNPEKTGFMRNDLDVDGSQESMRPSRRPANSNRFSASNLDFHQEPVPELPPRISAQKSPAETCFKRNKVDVDSRQEASWSQNGHAGFNTFPAYSKQGSPPLPSPIPTAAQETFQQALVKQEEIIAASQESKKPQASHDTFYTDYRFDFLKPQSIGQDVNQNTRPSAPHENNYTQAASQRTDPFQQQQQQQQPTSPPPVATASKSKWQANSYIWPMQSGHTSSSLSQVPRYMPDLQASKVTTNVADQYREHTGAGNELSLDGMPHDSDLDLLLHNDDDGELQGYTY